MSWAEIKKAVNDNLDYPLNRQKYIQRRELYQGEGTWTAPQDGYYLITCIGKGGNGGNGYAYGSSSRASGAGGGAGGMCRSLLYYDKGTEIAYSVTTSSSTFGEMVANAGGDGANGQGNGSSSAGGAGGTASGGNIFNLSGNNGASVQNTTGTEGAGGNTSLTTYAGRANGSGGAGYLPFEIPTLEPTGGGRSSGAGNLGGGTGGSNAYGGYGGAAFGGGGSGGSGIYASAQLTYSGGYGGEGAIIIEYLEEFFG